MDLLGRQIAGNLPQIANNLVDERFLFAWLKHNEMSPTLIGDFDERVASHVLNTYIPSVAGRHAIRGALTFVCFVHEFEKLVDDRLEKFPVRL
jgi:hypothetical protein